MNAKFMCPVCGFPNLTEDPAPPSGGGSYEICYSCGFEFGVTDDDKGFSYQSWRRKWVDEGMPWAGNGIDNPPDGWDPVSQLLNLTPPEDG